MGLAMIEEANTTLREKFDETVLILGAALLEENLYRSIEAYQELQREIKPFKNMVPYLVDKFEKGYKFLIKGYGYMTGLRPVVETYEKEQSEESKAALEERKPGAVRTLRQIIQNNFPDFIEWMEEQVLDEQDMRHNLDHAVGILSSGVNYSVKLGDTRTALMYVEGKKQVQDLIEVYNELRFEALMEERDLQKLFPIPR